MRDRHIPRLCRTCQAPMARQEDSCWRCSAEWADEPAPRTKLMAVAAPAEIDRGTDEGGSIAAVAAQ